MKVRFWVVLIAYLLSCAIIVTSVVLLYSHFFGGCCFNGGVSTSNEYATDVGVSVLKKGGNVVDAYVAMQAVLTVTEPYASGIGGGAFAMLYKKQDHRTYAYDGREEAPENIDVNGNIHIGGASSGVPGTVDLMIKLNKQHGTWSLKKCLEPAIKLAREGWKLDHYGATKLVDAADQLRRFNTTRAIYFNSDGSPKVENDLIINIDLANTLEIISENYMEFYNGTISKNILETITNDFLNPGVMNENDLISYQSVEREPIVYTYNGYELHTMNMPSSASTIPLALNILDSSGFNYTTLTVEAVRDIFNAMSIAFADRDFYMADADWVDVPLDGLLDPVYGKERSKLMNKTAVTFVKPGSPADSEGKGSFSSDDESFHTTQISIADQYGNVMSITSTIEQTWGNQIVVNHQGFLLNNELNDFSATGVNAPEGGKKPRRTALSEKDQQSLGGKRPRSSMSPTIIFKDGKPVFTLGSPGGWRIIATVFNTIIYLLQFEIGLDEAMDLPRFSTRNTGVWDVENGKFEQAWIDQLKQLGFDNINELSPYGLGSLNIVAINSIGNISAAADYRREGKSSVF